MNRHKVRDRQAPSLCPIAERNPKTTIVAPTKFRV
ncbi:hypothetical protein EAJSRFBN_CDS0202 [Salmonella phage SeKF_19]